MASTVIIGQTNVYEATAASLLISSTIFDYTNADTVPHTVVYASLTAPAVVRCDVTFNGIIQDTVWAGAGGSHSWWTGAGGGMLPNTGKGAGVIQPGDHLVITVAGPSAIRIDLV